ncbi:MAG: molybdenum cofactor guanylyltransferase [Candidatus Thiodiazotropha sp. (ex Notomyrtea botanica)]|nr:molybdenum cofactor guanylyltransferase [Candidatus Thiodiazotropha sp. (ex Notomyrtea botanica)]
MSRKSDITAVILAGGRGSRMGGLDKGLVELNGKPLIEHVIAAILDQVGTVVINANRNRDQYTSFNYPVIADSMDDYQGPLAGFLAAMEIVTTSYMVTVPCDGPMLSDDLVERLVSALERDQADIAVVHDGERMQPVYALIPIRLRDSLQAYLDGGDRKIDLWYAKHHVALADFSDLPSTFVNVNTPEERDKLQKGDTA